MKTKEKYFFEVGNLEDGCCTLSYWRDIAKTERRDIALVGAKITYGESFFWCSEHQDVGETSEECGGFCADYQPRNGKNGRCRFHKNTYEENGNRYTLTKYGGMATL